MFLEISIHRLAKYCSCIPGSQVRMVAASLVEENTEGQLWTAPQSLQECLLLLWDKGNNVFYIAGEPNTPELATEMSRLIMGEVRTLALATGLENFAACPILPWEEGMLPTLFPGVELTQVDKLFFGFKAEQPSPVAAPDIPGLEFAVIDKAWLARTDLVNLERVNAEIDWMWSAHSKNRMQEFGIAALVGQEVICWCTVEYQSEEKCGIGIETMAEYQNRGVASATTARFVKRCLERGIKPHWECGRDNGASVRVVEKVGFQQLEERTFWRGRFR